MSYADSLSPTESAGLHIRVLQHQGQSQDTLWQWPLHEQGSVALSRVLQDLAHIDPSTLEQAHKCKIARAGSHSLPVWWLTNASTELACWHNGQLLPAGKTVRLGPADTLEFGLTRLQITLTSGAAVRAQTEPEFQAPSTPDVTPKTKLDAPPQEPAPSERAELHESVQDSAAGLTALLQQHSTPGFFSFQDLGRKPDDLSDLLSKDLADEAPLAPTSGISITASTAAPTPSTALSTATPNALGTVTKPSDVDPLDALHEQYLLRLRNPYLATTADWQYFEHSQQAAPHDEFAQLKSQGGSGSVHELLQPYEPTYALVHGFNSLGDSQLLEPETFDSVMHLFAPPEFSQPAHTAPHTALPTLTRSEHHSLSIDSNLDFNAPVHKTPS